MSLTEQTPTQNSCCQCKCDYDAASMVQFGEEWVCVDCKPTFLQRLQEGVEDEESCKVAIHPLYYRAIGGLLLISFVMVTPTLMKWSSMLTPGNGKLLMPLANLVGLAAYLTASVMFIVNKRLAPVFLLVSYILGFLGLSISYIPFVHLLVPRGFGVYALWAVDLVVIIVAFVLRPPPKERSGKPSPEQQQRKQ